MNEKWDRRYLELAENMTKWSKDPSTKVAAIIIDHNKKILGTGYNGLPRRIADWPHRLEDRKLKNELVIHAEVNAVLDTQGADLSRATMYMVAKDANTGQVWGGAPCIRCMVHILQTDLNRIVTYPFKQVPSRWLESLKQSRELMDEVGMEYVEYDKHE